MSKVIFAPEGVDNFSYQGESYRITNPDGSISVPDACAAIMVESHGFRSHLMATTAKNIPTKLAVMADDDEDVTEDPSEVPAALALPSAAEFSRRLTQADMKAFLRHHEVVIPSNIKVRDLRKLVEDTYEAVATAPVGEQKFGEADEAKDEG